MQKNKTLNIRKSKIIIYLILLGLFISYSYFDYQFIQGLKFEYDNNIRLFNQADLSIFGFLNQSTKLSLNLSFITTIISLLIIYQCFRLRLIIRKDRVIMSFLFLALFNLVITLGSYFLQLYNEPFLIFG